MKSSVDKTALGITQDEIALGSHLIHFWQSDTGFAHGVLEHGIASGLIQGSRLGQGVSEGGSNPR
ncbi:MAG TPA: hypothetical protein VKB58_14925 [Terriglobales bacterium]|nr:hypothetical protein [Terriglobales bacterium]